MFNAKITQKETPPERGQFAEWERPSSQSRPTRREATPPSATYGASS